MRKDEAQYNRKTPIRVQNQFKDCFYTYKDFFQIFQTSNSRSFLKENGEIQGLFKFVWIKTKYITFQKIASQIAAKNASVNLVWISLS